MSVEPMSDIAYIATDIDFDHYFDTIVGVTIPDAPKVETVVFRTTEKRYQVYPTRHRMTTSG